MKPSYRPLTITFGTPSIEAAKELVVGRTRTAKQVWKSVEAGSVRLLSERRMGKTWLLRLAIATRPDWAAPVLLDAEGYGSALEFVQDLNAKLHSHHLIDDAWYQQTTDWVRRVLLAIQGKKAGDLVIPEIDTWFSLLQHTCKLLVEGSAPRKPIIIIDELPFFLDKLVKAGQSADAIRLLDTLRRLRQDFPSMRLVFCGSLGLHIVLQALTDSGYTGRPVNDMPPFEVPPLAPGDAGYLAGCLLLGEQIPCEPLDGCAKAVADTACRVPFYIQHMVKWMGEHDERPWTPRRIRLIPEDLFTAPGDPAEFAYYDGRLDQYYPEDVVDRARAALDVVSRKAKGNVFDEILNLVRHSRKTLTLDATALLDVLQMLRDDHYLIQERSVWRFKIELVRRWWCQHRGALGL